MTKFNLPQFFSMFLDIPQILEPAEGDRFWTLYQPFLRHRGYELRPRYQPDWQPSWRNKVKNLHDAFGKYEDYWTLFPPSVIDAIRIRDGVKVAIRCTERLDGHEIPNLLYLNSPEMRADPRNRTVPVLDILILPDRAFVVMPMLIFFHRLPFRHLGELSEAMDQILRGLVFMHEHQIVHRDACLLNIMMDPSRIIPGGFHFSNWRTTDGVKRKILWRERWSVRPTKYYFIDFETSVYFPPLTNPTYRYMFPTTYKLGQDKTVPELSDGSEYYDAYKLDVYQVGNAMRRVSLVYEDLSVFDPLFEAMTCRDPNKRISSSEAHQLFLDTISSWSEVQLSKRMWIKGTSQRTRFLIRHFHRMNAVAPLPTYRHFESPIEWNMYPEGIPPAKKK